MSVPSGIYRRLDFDIDIGKNSFACIESTPTLTTSEDASVIRIVTGLLGLPTVGFLFATCFGSHCLQSFSLRTVSSNN